jgi:hypothetical protein
MSSTSISISHGAGGLKMSDFTVGTLVPNAGDVEVRFNNTDTNGKNILDHEVVILLRTIIRQIEAGGPSSVNLLPRTGGAAPPPLV